MSVPPPLTRSHAETLRRLVREPSARNEGHSFVIEGPHLIERALAEAPSDVIEAYMTAEARAKHRVLLTLLAEQRVPVLSISAKQAERISDTRSPQGIFAHVSMPSANRFKSDASCILALDGVQDPGNVGTIVRAAAWFGVRQLLFGTGTADAYAPKTIRATQGEIFSVRCEPTASLAPALAARKKLGQKILCTTIDDAACPIYKEAFDGTFVVVLGSEADGVSPAVRKVADRTIVVPRIGTGESLNVAMTAVIILSEIAARRARIS